MAGNLQPKGLFEFAFSSFVSYMEGEARKLLELEPSPEAVAVTSRVCNELKCFFHGTRLPTFMANQLTKHLLIKLDSMYFIFNSVIRTECCQQMLLSLVEVFMHPDVTAIELGPSYYHGFDFAYCNIITWLILEKVCNLSNLKVLNLPDARYTYAKELKPVFPCQLKELTVQGSPHWCEDILRSIVESCPEMKSLSIFRCKIRHQDIRLVLQCKHLETLRLPKLYYITENAILTLVKGLSTDTASDVLSASTLKSLSLMIRDQNTLRLIVDKLPHLTEIQLRCKNIDLFSLTQLKNLRSLRLDALDSEIAFEYKKILPVLGKNLVVLEMKGVYTLDLEFIAETCTRLKCLHLSFISEYTEVNSSSKTFQNFKTVKCLIIRSPEAENDMAAFLIAQCINIERLTVTISGNLHTTIEDVLRRTPPLNLVVIDIYSPRNRHFIGSLLARHPNFHVVKTRDWIRLSSQAEVFDSFGCYRPT